MIKDKKTWMFLDSENGFSTNNPKAYVVEISNIITREILQALEMTQRGVYRQGGKWEEIMKDGKINYNLIWEGRVLDWSHEYSPDVYNLIEGNY